MSDDANNDSNDVELRLAAVRGRIDRVDRKIQALLAERGQAALDVAEIKKGMNPGEPVSFYRPEREAQILRDVAKRNEGPLADTSVQRIFREIISASLALEEPMKVAYLGPEGTYSHAATERHFGHAVTTLPEKGISEIFQTVEAGCARFGVVPVENSTEGTINHTLDRLMESPLRICGEVRLRIQHQLLSQETSLDKVRAVHAHPQSLAQCRNWLDAHLPGIQRISESSNAAAARLATNTPGIAAIAGEQAAERYQLQTLVAGIEDEKTNTTRFLVIGKQHIPPSGEDSTSLLVSAPHKPGGLRRLLQPLEDAGVSMTRIESRPGRTGLWEYVFFIDVAGHELDSTLKPVLEQLSDEAPLLRVLGSYPSALVESNEMV
ncbi:MAG: prephenate dehydratase [Granulosicoccus sp.]